MDVQNLEKSQRNKIIKELCDQGAGFRQLARITGISYGIIQRVVTDQRTASPDLNSFDSYTSNDGKHLLNIIHDTKNFRSLVYHMPGTNYFNHSRNSIIKPLSTTYQFYIWKSRK